MNSIKNFKTKSPKAFWAIIVVVVGLVVIGFVNNNNNGTPFSFSKTPQKMIQDAGTDKVWKMSFAGHAEYLKFGDNNKAYAGEDKDDVSSISNDNYKYLSNNEVKITGFSADDGYVIDLKDLKVENNKIKGSMDYSYNGDHKGMDVTLTQED
ncbi:hypothetical protein MUB42_05500 [Apilactobacillus kunkeei]|nr:hypothetical protein MUB42_05500 [Apilactobacillus kunkeei]